MTTRPAGVTRTLDGLRSRCTMPARCNATTPLISCASAARSRGTSGGARVSDWLGGSGGGAGVVEELDAGDHFPRVEPAVPRPPDLEQPTEIGVGDVAWTTELFFQG